MVGQGEEGREWEGGEEGREWEGGEEEGREWEGGEEEGTDMNHMGNDITITQLHTFLLLHRCYRSISYHLSPTGREGIWPTPPVGAALAPWGYAGSRGHYPCNRRCSGSSGDPGR